MKKFKNILLILNFLFAGVNLIYILYQLFSQTKFPPVVICKEEISLAVLSVFMTIVMLFLSSPVIILSYGVIVRYKDGRLLTISTIINLVLKLVSFVFTLYIFIYITGPSV